MEVYVTPDILELLKKGKILTISGSRYLSVEFAFEEEPEYVDYMLDKIRKSGLYPVIINNIIFYRFMFRTCDKGLGGKNHEIF